MHEVCPFGAYWRAVSESDKVMNNPLQLVVLVTVCLSVNRIGYRNFKFS